MADYDAIGAAIAVRFSAANITPPGGENAIREATNALPLGIGPLPASYVFPPSTGTLTGAGGERMAVVRYGVDFLRDMGVPDPRDLVALGKWLGVLVEALIGATQLGGAVARAWIASFAVGEITYAGELCQGIHFDVDITITEGISPVA